MEVEGGGGRWEERKRVDSRAAGPDGVVGSRVGAADLLASATAFEEAVVFDVAAGAHGLQLTVATGMLLSWNDFPLRTGA